MTKRKLLLATTILSILPFLSTPVMAEDDVAALRAQNAKLQRELAEIMERLDQIEAKTKESATKADTASAQAAKAVTVADDGSFKIPGTGTTVKVSGFAKLDVMHDIGNRPTTSGVSTDADQMSFATIPTNADTTALGKRDHTTRLSARTSRLNLTTATPTDTFGPVKTVFEFDLMGTAGSATATNSHTPRLRRAFGTIGHFLAGQEWSTFTDTSVLAETLDANGPAGTSTVRQAQLRYTYAFANGNSLMASVENPETDFTTTAPATNTNAINHYPDLVAAWRYDAAWGHLSLRGVLRNEAFEDRGAAPLGDENAWGYGLAGSGHWLPFADQKDAAYRKDTVFFDLKGGKGIGRYITETANLGAAVNNTTGDLDLQNAWGGFAGVRHFWTDSLRSTAAYGFARVDLENYLGNATTKDMDSVTGNLIWSPVPSTDVGVEYIWGHREVKNGDSGVVNRIMGSVKYNF